ncbi:porin [Escherichia coli]
MTLHVALTATVLAVLSAMKYEGFGIVGAYGAADRTNLQEAQLLGNGKKAEQWATGLKYDANNIYLAANLR